jgi:uncharacterized protein YbjT (DUF2867 family)
MARLLVIGASQGIGLETVKLALAAGHHVRAFARSAGSLPLENANLEKFAGDARDGSAIIRALEGRDAVIQTLGVPLTPDTVLHGTTLFSQTTRPLVDAMTAHGPRRLIVATGIGAGNSRDCLGPISGAAFALTLRRIYDDKDAQERIVQGSTLDWTIVRPGVLTSGPSTNYRALIDPKSWKPGSITRAAVARFLVEIAANAAFTRETPLLIG